MAADHVPQLRDPEAERRERRDRELLCADGALDVRGACAFLGIAKSRLYELVASGALPTLKLGRKRLVPRRALVALLADRLDEKDRA